MHLEASLWIDAAGLRQRLYNSRKRRSDGYMHEITYRYATADDIDGLLQSRLHMLRVVNNLEQDHDFDQEFINSSREYFLNGDQITVLAMDNGKIIGCASICFMHVMPTFSHPTGKRAHLMNVYTDAAYQRQGIAYKMTNMLIEAAWEKGATEISLDATESGRPLYEKCGFTFGNRFREFFRQQTGEEHFKFNVDMVASVKAVRETGDESFTLGDLLDIYYGKKTYAVYDRSALQWNKFVKDFCEDEATKIFKERLKAAAVLWKIVRESDMKKEYSHKLLEEYMESMEDALHFYK